MAEKYEENSSKIDVSFHDTFKVMIFKSIITNLIIDEICNNSVKVKVKMVIEGHINQISWNDWVKKKKIAH